MDIINELDNIQGDLQKIQNEMITRTIFPKSKGYTFSTCLVFYMADLHVDSNLKDVKDRKSGIRDMVDKILEDTPVLYSILQYSRLNKYEHMRFLPREEIYKVRNKLKELDAKENLTNAEAKERKKLEKREIQLTNEMQAINEKYEEERDDILHGLAEEEIRVVEQNHYGYAILLCGDISNNINDAALFFHRLREWIPIDNPIMYVLGNHELSQYKTIDEAVAEYKKMCKKERIVFLHNTCTDSFQTMGAKDVISSCLQIRFNRFVFFGGIGFNKFDDSHNANNIVTSADIQNNINKEREECESFRQAYKKVLDHSINNHKVMVVLSHYPVRDWMSERDCDSSCYYFCGHNHKNEVVESNGAYIFADNQIGYNSEKKSFKYVDLLGMYNPFYSYGDGVFEIDADDYRYFYLFSGEAIGTNGECKKIKKKIADGYTFKMIKKNNYYGFFLEQGYSIYICKGANISEIYTNRKNINYVYYCFERMINRYIELLLPYQEFQEKLAKEVRKIDGAGTKHGLIIDYNFTHHIMIDPIEKRLLFYYSPEYGKIMDLKSIKGLLMHVGYTEIETKQLLLGLTQESIVKQYSIEEIGGEKCDEIKRINIKESPYPYSRIMKNLERIFSSGILREWNEDIINKIDSNPWELPGE